MIDDITVAFKAPLPAVPSGMMQIAAPPGHPPVFGTTRLKGNPLFITYCLETQVATIRISVPRLLNHNTVNFPLVSISGVDDLRPSWITREASIVLLGFPVPPVATLPVTRVSYAADVRVSDPALYIRALSALRRRHGGTRTTWGAPMPSTIQWASKSLRVKLYDKGLELSSKSRCKGASGRTTCPTEDVLRFEVSILRAAAIRDAIGDVLQVRPEGSLLPCLALCCEPAISARILGREVARLRLDEDTIMAAGQVESLADRVRFVVASLRIRQRALQGEGAEPLGRRRSLTPARLYDMAAVHMLACAYGPAEIAAITGKSRSAVDDIISDLHATGIAPNASDLGSAPRLLDHLCRLLAPHYVDVPFTRQWTPDSAFVDAPWADEVPVSSTPTIAPDAFADLIVGVPGIDNDGVAA